jgi:hypothetical protein
MARYVCGDPDGRHGIGPGFGDGDARSADGARHLGAGAGPMIIDCDRLRSQMVTLVCRLRRKPRVVISPPEVDSGARLRR